MQLKDAGFWLLKSGRRWYLLQLLVAIISLDYLANYEGLLRKFFILSVINVNCSNWNMLVAILAEKRVVAENSLKRVY